MIEVFSAYLGYQQIIWLRKNHLDSLCIFQINFSTIILKWRNDNAVFNEVEPKTKND